MARRVLALLGGVRQARRGIVMFGTARYSKVRLAFDFNGYRPIGIDAE